ncbi:FAD-dependent oxidoreductase [Ancylobacter sp. 6x-1]|uniref:Tryptophan 2-monooxygenase n=1 Tax=Ancylobacter crimeensis TaxID=2579147 RepID=A0ABT0D5Z3_9HYPH|nr:NAD(P)/FAD-dependent oxidoreductase [Ancylobacter crimeensis]MCK0195365.1 FAD-dependent oxidoreductase [Ancylobacter crimeensis]
MSDVFDIVIIGAGAAGIGAAMRLVREGFTPLMIEALPRIGGRAWTSEAAGQPLDLGCGWLHSGDRNPWTRIAEARGFTVDRRPTAWDRQYRDLGFSAAEQEEAHAAFDAWSEQIATQPPASDCASDLLPPSGPWNAYLQALSGYISGDELERISARDYAAYDTASTYMNWRLPAGYGTLVADCLPRETNLRPGITVEAIGLHGPGVTLETTAGTLRTRQAILTVSTHVLAGSGLRLPPALDPWRDAAGRLPLGTNEKLFFHITEDGAFAPESHVLGNPRDPATGAYYIRPLGRPVIECFLGGAGARAVQERGRDAAIAHAVDELAALFGEDIRRQLRPLIASDWAGTASIGGGYSHALPGHAAARLALARPFEDRLFFAGEATHPTDFSTAHGAYESGVRTAEEVIASGTRAMPRPT